MTTRVHCGPFAGRGLLVIGRRAAVIGYRLSAVVNREHLGVTSITESANVGHNAVAHVCRRRTAQISLSIVRSLYACLEVGINSLCRVVGRSDDRAPR